ncbi:outer membrane protein [Sagittula marina]|uniref:Outer membrane protein n=2 Tax=Sagittula marina TaxID=943940 RepID=A0A7W6GR98_9RHOB|nr:TolC family outer membrane protein [Sagittula marina]MBB3984680.1 outer membrane protein [Sagittula marina]
MLGRLRTGGVRRVAAAVLAMSMATTALGETLAETLSDAYVNSGAIEQNRALLRAADEGVAQALAAMRPALKWSGGINRNYGVSGVPDVAIERTSTLTSSIELSVQLVLYAGGQLRLGVDLAKESVLATRATLLSAEQTLLLNATFSFLAIREATESLNLRQNNVRVIRQEVRAARDRFEVGEVTRTDVALAEARLAAAVAALAAAEGALITAGEQFHRFVGRDPGQLVQPTRLPKIPGSVAEAKSQAVRRHPEIISAQHQVAASELRILIAKGAMKPTVSVTGSYGLTESFNNRSFNQGGSVSLGASGPIYQGGELSSLVRQAMANRDASRAQLHVVYLTIEQNVGQAYSDLRVAQANKTSFQEQVRAARVAFQGVREEAALGARTTLDVLDAEQELLDARASLISAEISEFQAAYSVLSAIGLMTPEALQLAVPQFDPSQYYNMVRNAPVSQSKQGKELDRVLRALGKD